MKHHGNSRQTGILCVNERMSKKSGLQREKIRTSDQMKQRFLGGRSEGPKEPETAVLVSGGV